MKCEGTKLIRVLNTACSDKDRHLPPTRAPTDELKASLTAHGQISPIAVFPVSRGTYRVIVGATRFRAASEMNWKTIRAEVWIGSAAELELHELAENLDRRELTDGQRHKMKERIRELQ